MAAVHQETGQQKAHSCWVLKQYIAESYERIHRSNLVGMGVLPLQYINGDTAEKLGLTGKETFSITGIAEDIKPLKKVQVIAKKEDGT